MGLDLEKSLKSLGYSVDRITKIGWNDSKLLNEVQNLGDVSRFDKVFLYCGGNSSSPSVDTIESLVNALGGSEKVVVILPPQNSEASDKSKKNYDGLTAKSLSPMLWIFPSSDFWPDGVHLKPGSKSSKLAASEVIEATRPAKKYGFLFFGSVVLGTVLLLRRSRRTNHDGEHTSNTDR